MLPADISHMALSALLVLIVLGLAASAVMASALTRHLTMSRWSVGARPGVSILKPLKGVDPSLEENLESFFHLNYPAYQLLFGVKEPNDPAAEVARRLMARNPRVPARLVVGGRSVGMNPKVNNLAGLIQHAEYDFLLVSDSNVRVNDRFLDPLVAQAIQPKVGLVSAPFRGVEGSGWGGRLEALQLNSFVAGGTCALSSLFDQVCVVGKTMLIRREVLEAMGGFSFLGRFLAEDQVCGQETVRLGWQVRVAGPPVDNVVGRVSVARFLSRHLRWARIRRRVNPLGYAGEILLNPTFLSLGGFTFLPWAQAVVVVATALLVETVLAARMERLLECRSPIWQYPGLIAAKNLLLGCAWVVPFVHNTVSWRGNRLSIGPRTALKPVGGLAGRKTPSVREEMMGPDSERSTLLPSPLPSAP